MKRLVLLSWLVVCCTGATAQTQEPDPLSFFPHQVGDTWFYLYNQSKVDSLVITDIHTDDTCTFIYYNGHTAPSYILDKNYNVYKTPLQSDLRLLEYKLTAQQGNQWVVSRGSSSNIVAVVIERYQALVLGRTSVVMVIDYYETPAPDTVVTENSAYWYRFYLASGFGFIRHIGEAGDVWADLVGCVINGDTLGIVTDVADRGTTPPVALRIAPNPCDVAATLQCALPAGVLSAHVELSDVFGRVLYSTEMQGETCTIPTASLAEGMYFCRVVAAQHTAVQMVCVQR